jgi:putative thioredoxin
MGSDVRDFHEEVIEASQEVPILVDFWAQWCGPCRILGPILERLAGEADGRWRLAKVDTEAHPDVAAAYGIRSIPDVRLFVGGEAVDGFMGALPEPNIRRWLAEALPGAGEREATRELARVDALIREGRREEARDALELLLDREPGHAEAQFRLARILVFSDPVRAMELLGRIEPAGVAPEALDAMRTFGRLFLEDSAGPPEDPFRPVVRRLREEDFAGAMEVLLRILREEGPGARDRVRKASVAVFHHLGHDHPLVRRFRGELSRALHV